LKVKYVFIVFSIALALGSFAAAPANAGETSEIILELQALKARVTELEAKLAAQQEKEEAEKQTDMAQKEDEPGFKEIVGKVIDKKNPIKIGGALRVNYSLKDWDDSARDRGGDFDFDIFRLNLDGEINDIILSAEYRWYEYMSVIHHGWVGYNFTDSLQGQLGVTQVPFGLLPYASHNWWFALPYYAGLEADFDMGIKLIAANGPFNIQAAFFKNDEWGNSSDTERFSFDVISAGLQQNEESNQLNLRAAYTLKHGDVGNTELGISGEWGQLYNNTTRDSGDHWAGAAHLNGNYGNLNVMLEYIRYGYNPENPMNVPDSSVLMGAFGGSFEVASEANVYVANLAYGVPVNWGPISRLTFYDDYSYIDKIEDGWNSSQINTLGCMVTAGSLYTYIDIIAGKNAPWLGSGADALTAGTDDGWHTRFNINFGFYF